MDARWALLMSCANQASNGAVAAPLLAQGCIGCAQRVERLALALRASAAAASRDAYSDAQLRARRRSTARSPADSAVAAADAPPDPVRGPGCRASACTPSSSTVVASASLNEASLRTYSSWCVSSWKMIDASSTSFQLTMVLKIGSSKCPSVEYAATPPTTTSNPCACRPAAKRRALCLDEIASVGHAADDGKTPALRARRKIPAPQPHSIRHRAGRYPHTFDSCRCPAAPARGWRNRGSPSPIQLRAQLGRRRGLVDDAARWARAWT